MAATTSRAKVDEAVTIALETVRDAAPGLLTLTEVAEKVASHAGVSASTARNRLRTAIEEGSLLELKPWSRKFFIDLPGGKEAGVGPFYIAMEWTSTGPVRDRGSRKVITTDDEAMRPSSYGPGNTTYVTDPELAREYVQQLADEKKAKEEAEREAERQAEKAERREINRRFPGLNRLLRRVMLVGQDARENGARVALLEADTRLSYRDAREGKGITERTLHLDIKVWGDANVAIMQSILAAGISSHLADQPLILCRHCEQRILRTTGDRQWWWHVDTTNASCAEGGTKAEPVKENDR